MPRRSSIRPPSGERSRNTRKSGPPAMVALFQRRYDLPVMGVLRAAGTPPSSGTSSLHCVRSGWRGRPMPFRWDRSVSGRREAVRPRRRCRSWSFQVISVRIVRTAAPRKKERPRLHQRDRGGSLCVTTLLAVPSRKTAPHGPQPRAGGVTPATRPCLLILQQEAPR